MNAEIWSFVGPAGALTKKLCPKLNKFEKGYLYVVQLSSGWLKIGRTADPVDRLAGIRRGMRSTGTGCARR
jgi:hypothetical protein